MSKKKKIEHYPLEQIESPEFLKDLSYDELEVLASDIRKDIIANVSESGGHLSSNLGVVDLTIALHRSFDFKKDLLLFDVGHQCYAHKILTGRSLKNIRTRKGVSGFIERNESPYDIFESGHSSTSISVADGLAIAKKDEEDKPYIVTLIGDSSLLNGVAFEGLNFTGHFNLPLIIVLNDNGMSITPTVGGLGKFFSKISTSSAYLETKSAYRKLLNKTRLGKKIYLRSIRTKNVIKRWLVPTTLFDNLGFTYIGPIDGHDIRLIEKCIKRAKKSTRPVLIHAKTRKGFGYDKAMVDKEGYWHGASPFHVETGEPKNMHQGYVSYSHVYGELIYETIRTNENAYLITPATPVGANLMAVAKDFSNRFYDVGISEEHALSFAEGLALANKLPIVSIYSTFFLRAVDQLITDLARQRLKAILTIERAGLVGADGKTHQGYFDNAIFFALPYVSVSMARDKGMARQIFQNASEEEKDVHVIRIPRDYLKEDEKELDYSSLKIGDWLTLKENNHKIALISYGPILNKIMDRLSLDNIDIDVYDAIYQKPIDVKLLEKIAKNHETIIIHDAYSTRIGLVDEIIYQLSKLPYKNKIVELSIPKGYIERGSIAEQEKDAHVSVDDVIDAIKKNI